MPGRGGVFMNMIYSIVFWCGTLDSFWSSVYKLNVHTVPTYACKGWLPRVTGCVRPSPLLLTTVPGNSVTKPLLYEQILCV